MVISQKRQLLHNFLDEWLQCEGYEIDRRLAAGELREGQ